MTSAWPDLKFATGEDVTARSEKPIPNDRMDWIELRLSDIEAELMGKVPSLRKPLADIEAESAAAGDPGRLNRVRALVCNKVLDLYRNPDGAVQKTQAMGDISASTAYYRDSTRGAGTFSLDELDSVRLKSQRSRFGTVTVAPWKVG